NALGKACFMYADVPANAMFPTCGKNGDPYADNTPMISLNLLYTAYVADYRCFSCPSKPTISLLSNLSSYGTPGGTFLSAQSCGYGYDPGHSNKDALAAIMADKKGAGANSDNHGPNAGQNVALGNGAVEWMTTPIRKLPNDEK